MMRTMNSNRQLNSTNVSQQGDKTKKLGMTSSNSKTKNLSSSVTSMATSLKKNTTYELKSTSKKFGTALNSNTSSNKSLKGVKQVTSNPIYQQLKRQQTGNKENMQKKGTIPVKNIKQRICGMPGKEQTVVTQPHTTKLNTTSAIEHMNNHNNSKKFTNNSELSTWGKKQKSTQKHTLVMQKHYYHNMSSKDTKMTIKSRDKSSQLLNFTSALHTQQNQQTLSTTALSMQQFQLGRKLGKGRFGDVFMARQTRTGFALAIKIINKKQLKESQMQKQLIQEIKIQMYSNHPNILKMYGFFADKAKIYLLLELATNGCLFKQIRKKSYLPQNLASFYFRQVTSGVRYLHSNSVIHRDIKPQNILNCFNVLKLCDFGWAIYSPIQQFFFYINSQRQTFCGTLDYVPPEIVTGEFYDEKADVWCLGVLCYQLCTGKAPFQSTTDENQTYDKILKVNIQFPIYLSQQIVDFVGKILTRDPAKRLGLEEVESHQWMRMYENETGRMISKEIWDRWMELAKN